MKPSVDVETRARGRDDPRAAASSRSAATFWERPRSGGALVVGHRGARGDAPENTLGAFAHAADLGAAAIELDVRTCASGEVVVHHDPTLARLTEDRDGRRVADLSWGELSRVRLARGERVPLLVEVLSAMRARGVGVNVEMKHDVPDPRAVVRAVAAVLRAWDASHPIVVSSFDPRMIRALARLAPSVQRAQLVHRSRYHFAMLAAVTKVTSVSPRPLPVHAVHLDRELAAPRRIEALHARGLRVAVWTVNDPAEARSLDALGVSAIITDVPDRLR